MSWAHPHVIISNRLTMKTQHVFTIAVATLVLLATTSVLPLGAVTNSLTPGSLDLTFDPTLTVLPMPVGPGSLDVTFDMTECGQFVGVGGSTASVFALLPLPDRTVLVRDDFIGVSDRHRNGVAALDSDGNRAQCLDPFSAQFLLL